MLNWDNGEKSLFVEFVKKEVRFTCLKLSVQQFFFLFLNQNICCGYSKEPSQWEGSFEHQKHLFEMMGKKLCLILRSNILFI